MLSERQLSPFGGIWTAESATRRPTNKVGMQQPLVDATVAAVECEKLAARAAPRALSYALILRTARPVDGDGLSWPI